MGAFVTLAMEVMAFIAFIVVVAVMPYVRRKRGYWTSRGVRVPPADIPTVMSTLPGVQLDDKHLGQYYREGKKSTAAVLGLYDGGRACVLACDCRVAADAMGNDGFAEVDNHDSNNSLIPSTVNADAVVAVLPVMNECVGELITSMEAVANRQLTIMPWTEVRKCAVTVVATCVYGQPMIDSRIKLFAGQCDKVLLNGRGRNRSTPTDYFTAYDLSSDDRKTSTDFKRLLRSVAEESKKLSSDVADKQVRLDMFEFVTGTIEPTAVLVTAALYELACNKEIQNRLREHLDSELDEHQQQVTIDQLDRLYYLENVLRETLRKYPLVAAIHRKTTKPYTVPGGGHITLEPGTLTVVPVHAIHHDDRQFVAPETFNPQRFPAQLSSAYMPNGSGPQSYISKHFVGLEAKLIIAMLICRYEVHINSIQPGRSPDPFDTTSFANIRMKLSNRSNVRETTMGASLRQLNTTENSEKKFLFF